MHLGAALPGRLLGVELLDADGPMVGTNGNQTPNTSRCVVAVSQRGISSVVERETAQIVV